MRLELGRARRHNLVVGRRVLVVRQRENGRQLVRKVVDDELAAQLAVQRAEPRGHQRREVALDDPLLERHGARGALDDVEEPRARKVADAALVLDVVHQHVEEREVLLLHAAREALPVVLGVPLLRRGAGRAAGLVRLEPHIQYVRQEPDLGGDVKGQLDNLGLGVAPQAYAVLPRDAHEQVRQAGGEVVVLDEGLLLGLDQRGEEEDGLPDDVLVVRGGGDLADGHVDLLDGGELDARVGQGPAGLVGEDGGELVQADLELVGGLEVAGEVGRVAPYLLGEGASVGGVGSWGRVAGGRGRGRGRTRSWPYSLSNRLRRFAGSLAASRRAAPGVREAWLRRRDHWMSR